MARALAPGSTPGHAWGGHGGIVSSVPGTHTALGTPVSSAHMDENQQQAFTEQKRFMVELEFVQALANPNYINYLAQHKNKYFEKKEFINYLKYLLYWKRPEYVRYLRYPQCLHFLELLQNEKFREAMVNPQNATFIEDQQILQWQHYIRKRMRLHEIPISGNAIGRTTIIGSTMNENVKL